MERRISRLETAYRPGMDRAALERIASAEGIDPDELYAEAVRVMDAIGPPYTVERIADYYAATDGLTPAERDELIDRARRGMERYQ